MIVPDHIRDSYVGTSEYMAPEMKECKPHDQTLDLWCIGILIY
jgi:serine/threonine protein kinase